MSRTPFSTRGIILLDRSQWPSLPTITMIEIVSRAVQIPVLMEARMRSLRSRSALSLVVNSRSIYQNSTHFRIPVCWLYKGGLITMAIVISAAHCPPNAEVTILWSCPTSERDLKSSLRKVDYLISSTTWKWWNNYPIPTYTAKSARSTHAFEIFKFTLESNKLPQDERRK